MLTPEELDKVCTGHCNLSDGFCLHHLIATEDKMFVQMVRVMQERLRDFYMHYDDCCDCNVCDTIRWLRSVATAIAIERGIK